MRACQHIVDALKKRSGHTWIKAKIRKYENIEQPNILQQANLCHLYRVFASLPFPEDDWINPVQACCSTCRYRLDALDVFRALHSEKYGRFVWGEVE
jgi:hypothetical protein